MYIRLAVITYNSNQSILDSATPVLQLELFHHPMHLLPSVGKSWITAPLYHLSLPPIASQLLLRLRELDLIICGHLPLNQISVPSSRPVRRGPPKRTCFGSKVDPTDPVHRENHEYFLLG